MSSSNDVQVLETFTDRPVTVHQSSLLANCKSVDQFKKVKLIGEGTYGLVCKCFGQVSDKLSRLIQSIGG